MTVQNCLPSSLATLREDEFIYGSSNPTDMIRLFAGGAPCGGPRFVNDDCDTEISFSKYWVPNLQDSYSVIAVGDSMKDAYIFDGDMLVIDCSREPRHGDIVAAWIDGDMTIKRLNIAGEGILLMPENDEYDTIIVDELSDFKILGVVTSVHRHL
jgi:DNA polymerase V